MVIVLKPGISREEIEKIKLKEVRIHSSNVVSCLLIIRIIEKIIIKVHIKVMTINLFNKGVSFIIFSLLVFSI